MITERVQPGVVYTTFHHPETRRQRGHHRLLRLGDQLPEYKVTAVQVRRTNGPSDWQEQFEEDSVAMRRVDVHLDAAE